jgi:hypothetical protein
MDSANRNFCLAPDLKKVRPKKVANDKKNQFGTKIFFGLFL